MRTCALLSIQSVHKSSQFLGVRLLIRLQNTVHFWSNLICILQNNDSSYLFSKIDHIYIDLLFFQSFCQLHELWKRYGEKSLTHTPIFKSKWLKHEFLKKENLRLFHCPPLGCPQKQQSSPCGSCLADAWVPTRCKHTQMQLLVDLDTTFTLEASLKNLHTCATRMPVQNEMVPCGCTAWSFESMRPVSGVKVVRTSQLLLKTNICVLLNAYNNVHQICASVNRYTLTWP